MQVSDSVFTSYLPSIRALLEQVKAMYDQGVFSRVVEIRNRRTKTMDENEEVPPWNEFLAVLTLKSKRSNAIYLNRRKKNTLRFNQELEDKHARPIDDYVYIMYEDDVAGYYFFLMHIIETLEHYTNISFCMYLDMMWFGRDKDVSYCPLQQLLQAHNSGNYLQCASAMKKMNSYYQLAEEFIHCPPHVDKIKGSLNDMIKGASKDSYLHSMIVHIHSMEKLLHTNNESTRSYIKDYRLHRIFLQDMIKHEIDLDYEGQLVFNRDTKTPQKGVLHSTYAVSSRFGCTPAYMDLHSLCFFDSPYHFYFSTRYGTFLSLKVTQFCNNLHGVMLE